MKLLLDMNLSRYWIDWLANFNFHATHWSQVGEPAAPDSEVMAYAFAHGLIILTRDLDLGETLVRSRASQPSVIQIRTKQAFPELVGLQLVEVLRDRESELAAGALVTVHLERTRLRLLTSRPL